MDAAVVVVVVECCSVEPVSVMFGAVDLGFADGESHEEAGFVHCTLVRCQAPQLDVLGALVDVVEILHGRHLGAPD